MADTVNEIMDRMAPELHDLETNGIFSHVGFFWEISNAQAEIASIIRKRRNMEYALYSYSKNIRDYLSAIEYEINLDSLRKLRKRRLGIDWCCYFTNRFRQAADQRLQRSESNLLHFRAYGEKVPGRSERVDEIR